MATAATRSTLRLVLLSCGLLASLLYVGADIFAGMRYEGYSFTAQTISELSAIDSPTRPFLVLVGIVYYVLVIAFGLGVWRAAGHTRALGVVGGLLVGFGVAGLTVPIPPMHQREVLGTGGATLSDTLHIVRTMINVLFILSSIGFGATAFGIRFRFYSIGTLVVLVLFGALAALDGPRIGANLPTPWVGVTERINVYGSMLWFAVLASVLLRKETRRGPAASDGRAAEVVAAVPDVINGTGDGWASSGRGT